MLLEYYKQDVVLYEERVYLCEERAYLCMLCKFGTLGLKGKLSRASRVSLEKKVKLKAVGSRLKEFRSGISCVGRVIDCSTSNIAAN